MIHDPPLPLLKDRYQLIMPLGGGGMGTVYLAEDRRLGNKRVAVKENRHSSLEQQEQFNREALLLSNLEDYPNLPRVTDSFTESDGRQYLVMDYIDGDNLLQILQSQHQPLPEAQVLSWLDSILTALAFLHQRPKPIIHRDIKPSNVKLRTDGKIFLVDFGLAKVSEDDHTMAGARGAVTVGYAPPEQYSGGTDARSDIYALGATLYHLLTGRKPPDSRTLVDKTTRLIAPRTINPNISRKLERVILKAMALAPKDRYQTVGELNAALPGSRQQPSTLYPLATTRAPGVPRKRKGSVLDFLLIALGVVLGVLILLLWLKPDALTFLSLLTLKPAQTETLTPTVIATSTTTPTTTATPLVAPNAIAADRLCPTDNMILIKDRESAFCIDQTEVTNAAYRECVKLVICERLTATEPIPPDIAYTDYSSATAYDNYPVLHITVEQAAAYCQSYRRVTLNQRNARLPTFEEWMLAYEQSATAPIWADRPLSVTDQSLYSAAANLYGLRGNVQEWVVAKPSSLWVALGENFLDSAFPKARVNIDNYPNVLAAEASRARRLEVGFRCVADVNEDSGG